MSNCRPVFLMNKIRSRVWRPVLHLPVRFIGRHSEEGRDLYVSTVRGKTARVEFSDRGFKNIPGPERKDRGFSTYCFRFLNSDLVSPRQHKGQKKKNTFVTRCLRRRRCQSAVGPLTAFSLCTLAAVSVAMTTANCIQ